jgi:hypothetical protein
MIRILLLLFLCSSLSFGQIYTSTIRGSVKDADTGLPLAGAAVQVAGSQQGVSSNADGTFRFNQIPVGRYVLKISYLGYEPATIPEILLESGKEIVIEIKLNQAGKQLQEATVLSARPVAFNSVQAITTEQTLRYRQRIWIRRVSPPHLQVCRRPMTRLMVW